MRRRHAAGLALVLSLGLGACERSSQAKTEAGQAKTEAAQAKGERREPAAADRPAIRVATAMVEARPVQRTVETVGSLLAWEEVMAKSQATGTVVRLYADLGDTVREGQPLAELDRREADLGLDQLQADLVTARENLVRARAAAEASRANLERVRGSRPALEADLTRARADAEWRRLELERNRELASRQLIATRDVDNTRIQYEMGLAQVRVAETTLAQLGDQLRVADAQLQADLGGAKAAEAQVRQREAALDLGKKRQADTTVPAPMSGLIAKRHTAIGDFVKDNTPLFTLVLADPLKYTGTIPERFAPDLRVGQEVQLQVEAYPGRAFPGRVTRIAPAVDVQTRTLALEARVPNGQGQLRPGFFGRGVVLTRQEAGVAFVPAEAVAYFVGITKVFVIADGTARERLIKAGLREAGRVEILDGVKPGEVVATSGLAQLYDGAAVQLAEARPPAPGAPARK
jgi:membrane fusion protein (multidrug efflux system)